jgi:putative endonuclease
MSNGKNSVLYTGVTNDLIKRVHEHKEKVVEGFTKKYKINKLVYFEVFDSVENAILREKQIKGGSRQKKIDLITNMNPEWKDLYEQLWDCFAALAMTEGDGSQWQRGNRNDREGESQW